MSRLMIRRLVRRQRNVGLGVWGGRLSSLSLLLCVGCVQNINTPTQTAGPTVTATVRALQYQSTTPVPGAVVTVDGRESGTTQADGACRVQVPLGRETTIAVRKLGWETMVPWAAGTVNADGETWTFYLRPALDP